MLLCNKAVHVRFSVRVKQGKQYIFWVPVYNSVVLYPLLYSTIRRNMYNSCHLSVSNLPLTLRLRVFPRRFRVGLEVRPICLLHGRGEAEPLLLLSRSLLHVE